MIMRISVRSLLLFLCCVLTRAAWAEQVVFSEIMYQPPVGKPEFIEVWNITNTPLDMAKWRFSDGVNFTFPDFNAGSAQAHFLKPMERILVSAVSDARGVSFDPGRCADFRAVGCADFAG